MKIDSKEKLPTGSVKKEKKLLGFGITGDLQIAHQAFKNLRRK